MLLSLLPIRLPAPFRSIRSGVAPGAWVLRARVLRAFVLRGLALASASALVLVLSVAMGQLPVAVGQSPEPPSEAVETLSADEQTEIIEMLGSPRFADREDAIARARDLGTAILPALRTASMSHSDAEVRTRAKFVYSQIVEGNFEARAEAFLAGNDVGDAFAGWNYVSSLMEDNAELREVFVATSRIYPQLMDTLDGNSRERSLELDHIVHQILHKMLELRQVPTREDVLATLWVIADANVLISDDAQALTLSLLRKASANELRKNAQLHDSFMALVGRWVRRSPVTGAHRTLSLSMQWDMAAESRILGMRAAYEARDVEDVHAGLQAIARFGTAADVPFVLPFLNDPREDPEALPPPEGFAPVRTSDVAMATIAKIYGVSLDEIGFPNADEHPKVAFAVESLGFPTQNPELRDKVLTRLKKLMFEHKHIAEPPVEQPPVAEPPVEQPPVEQPPAP